MGKSSTTPASTGRVMAYLRVAGLDAIEQLASQLRGTSIKVNSVDPGTLSWRHSNRRSVPRAPALVGLGASAYANDTKRRNAWIGLHQKRWLDKGKITKLVESLRQIQTTDAELAKKIRNEADYFATNAVRMNYPKFRKQHLFVGSGVIEAGCKTVIAHRLKHSGMFWTVKGANSILALRCSHLNGRFEDYWVGRRAA